MPHGSKGQNHPRLPAHLLQYLLPSRRGVHIECTSRVARPNMLPLVVIFLLSSDNGSCCGIYGKAADPEVATLSL